MNELLELPPTAVDEFATFWESYPRKTNKVAAGRAFLAARRRASLESILLGVERFPWDDRKRFIPHASTWLNNDRWTEQLIDPSDQWGLTQWYREQPVEADGLFWVRGWELEALRDVMLATGFEFRWRGDLETLGRWICAGFRPDSVCEVIGAACAASASVPRLLAFFERAVLRFAFHWHSVRCEWVRG